MPEAGLRRATSPVVRGAGSDPSPFIGTPRVGFDEGRRRVTDRIAVVDRPEHARRDQRAVQQQQLGGELVGVAQTGWPASATRWSWERANQSRPAGGPRPTVSGSVMSGWVAEHPSIRLGTFAEAASHAELIVNAASGLVSIDVLTAAGAASLDGKVLLDGANVLDFSRGMPPRVGASPDDSLAERIQAAFPGARIVKALHTMNAYLICARGAGAAPLCDAARVCAAGPRRQCDRAAGPVAGIRGRERPVLQEWPRDRTPGLHPRSGRRSPALGGRRVSHPAQRRSHAMSFGDKEWRRSLQSR
jgi:hypothetical protein